MDFIDQVTLNCGDSESSREWLERLRSPRARETLIQAASESRVLNKSPETWTVDELRKIVLDQQDEMAALWSALKIVCSATLTLTNEKP